MNGPIDEVSKRGIIWNPFVLPKFHVIAIMDNLVEALDAVSPAFLDVYPGGRGVLLGRTLKEVIFISQHRSLKLGMLVVESPCQDSVHGNDLWLKILLEASISHHPRTHSDHCPLKLELHKDQRNVSKVFRLKTMWIKGTKIALSLIAWYAISVPISFVSPIELPP